MASAKTRKTAPTAEDAPPLIRLKRTRKPETEPELVRLFVKEYDDGEVEEFWVPKRKMASLALKYLHMTRADGENVAVAWAMEKVLGEEAYANLMEDDQLGDDELAQIFAIVQNAIMGATESPKD